MAIALVDSFGFAAGANGGTSGSRTTTGANLFVMCVGTATTITGVSDNINGSWTSLTEQVEPSAAHCQIWYFENGSGGTGHTFSLTGSGIYPSCIVFSFSGAATASVFDVENGTHNTGTSIQPGSVTPTGGATDSLSVTALGAYLNTDTISMPSGYAGVNLPSVGGVSYHGAGAYKIKTDGSAENPTWTWSTSSGSGVAIALFKAAAGGAATIVDPMGMTGFFGA